jgi:glycosyltransferase involved in cell wall biosynthesis
MKKRLLVYAHYFYPDVASTGQILTELCEGLQENFDITVICVVPSYGGKVEDKYKKKRLFIEKYKNISIVRVRVPSFEKSNKISRVKNILAYFINGVYATFRVGKQDLVFSISQPPILGGVLGVIGKVIKRAKFIYNIQDFNPEQIIAVGYSKSKLILKIAMMLDKFSCKRADKIIVVGRDMQDTLRVRFTNKKIPKNVYINNWVDEKEIYPLQDNNENVIEFKKKHKLENKIVIMYSGNIGLYYDLKNLIKVISRFNRRDDLVFAFIGDGSVKQELESYANKNKLDNIRFIPYQDKEDLIFSLNAADVHLVVSAKGIKGVSVPSKLYGVMAAGKTVLGVLEEGSEARLIVEESNCGICVEPGNYDLIYKELKKVIENIQEYKSVGIKGRDFIGKYIKKEVAINKYCSEILCGDDVVIEVNTSDRPSV